MNLECKVCGNSKSNSFFTAREMMMQIGDEFDYLKCFSCGCIQIADVPDNLSKYYAEDYYSFSQKGNLNQRGLKVFLKGKLFSYYNFKGNFIGSLVSLFKNDSYYWFPKYLLKNDAAILDVGCGNGSLLEELYNCGLENLTGVDLFIKKDILLKGDVKIYKEEMKSLPYKYDFVMMHHSFEHMSSPLEVFRDARKIIKKDGFLLIRIPVADSYACEFYKEYWVQLDAPRHLFIHTRKSIQLLADKSGFRIIKTINDSGGFQFWGSESYKMGYKLEDAYLNKNRIFTDKQLAFFEEKAKKLNSENRGDSMCFLLQSI